MRPIIIFLFLLSIVVGFGFCVKYEFEARTEPELPLFSVQSQGTTLWICGWDCYRSKDSGRTWVQISEGIWGGVENYDPTQLDGLVQLVSPEVGYRIFRGVVLKTRNAGDSWTEIFSEQFVYQLHFWNEEEGIILERSGNLSRTSDGGTTWNEIGRLTSNLINAGNAKLVLGERDRVFATFGKGLLKSDDGGGTWRQLAKPNHTIYGITYSQGFLWTVGWSPSSGSTWARISAIDGQVQEFSIPDGHSGHAIYVWNDLKILARGGKLAFSKLNSNQWQVTNQLAPNRIAAMAPSEDFLYMAGGVKSSLWFQRDRPRSLLVRTKDLRDWDYLQVPTKPVKSSYR